LGENSLLLQQGLKNEFLDAGTVGRRGDACQKKDQGLVTSGSKKTSQMLPSRNGGPANQKSRGGCSEKTRAKRPPSPKGTIRPEGGSPEKAPKTVGGERTEKARTRKWCKEKNRDAKETGARCASRASTTPDRGGGEPHKGLKNQKGSFLPKRPSAELG